jgi:pantoate--beta-alanine ligase
LRTLRPIHEMRAALQPHQKEGATIGFVPTMGALHEGHASLIRLARMKCDVIVVSIFVNPTQFGPNEDYDAYPRTLDEDSRKLIDENVDFLFMPDAKEIYPSGASTSISMANFATEFEGAIRPHHFDGVATVVAALFNIVSPTIAFFGQKDAQQVAVVKRMTRDLHFPLEIMVGPTIREADGLALSSRNRFLNGTERQEAVGLSKALFLMEKQALAGVGLEVARSAALELLTHCAPSAVLDYLEAVDSETFRKIGSFEAVETCTIVIAARFGKIRLLDNIVIRPGK